eukprot:g2927.t1
MTTLPDGRAICVGGYNGQDGVLDTVEVYDPETDVWEMLAPCIIPRANCALGVVDGKLIAAGGFDERHVYLRSAEMYDPATDTWTRLPSMRHRRSSCASVVNATPFVLPRS